MLNYERVSGFQQAWELIPQLHFRTTLRGGAWILYKAEEFYKSSYFIAKNGVGFLALVDQAVVMNIMLFTHSIL